MRTKTNALVFAGLFAIAHPATAAWQLGIGFTLGLPPVYVATGPIVVARPAYVVPPVYHVPPAPVIAPAPIVGPAPSVPVAPVVPAAPPAIATPLVVTQAAPVYVVPAPVRVVPRVVGPFIGLSFGFGGRHRH
jgi:hypothetical protein